MDIDGEGGKVLVPALLDLLQYEHPPLQKAALNLLLKHFR
jgi:hypothetical protein